MIAHTSIAISQYPKAKAFYSALLKPLGYTQTMEYGEAAGYNDGTNTDFWIGKAEGGTVVKQHVAFTAKNKDEVDNFYAAGLEAGGKDNGAPGYRTDYWPGYYAAFIYDMDGNNVEAVWYDYSKVEKK